MADRRPSGGSGKGRPPGKSSGGPRPPGKSKGQGQGGYRSSGGPGPRGGRHQGPRHQGGGHQGGPKRFERTGGQEKFGAKAKGGSDRGERLQKVLAQAGVGSRRACEELIKQGRVTVDGKTVRELGVRVEPMSAHIAVDGERVRLERAVYYAVNKPKGYVSTNDDPAGRPRVVDILAEVPERVYTVGRLDEESTGLMILTNDGELANRLAHPRYGVEKIYRAVVAGAPSPDVLRQLSEGVWLSDGKARAKRAKVIGARGEATIVELALAEGKNREVRRMLARFGHKVMSLTRVAIGPVSLRGLPVGEFRPLTPVEVDLLHKVAAGIQVAPPRISSRGQSAPQAKGRRPGQGQGQGQGRRHQEEHVPRSRRNEAQEREGGGPHRGGRPPFQAGQGQGPRQGYGAEAEMEQRLPRGGPGRGPQSGPGRPAGDRGPRQHQHQRPEGPGGRPPAPPRPDDRGRGPGGAQRVTGPPPGLPPSQRRPPSAERPGAPVDEPKVGRRIIGLPPRHRPEADEGPSRGPKGSNVRKRPMSKRVPPRKAFGVKRRKPGEEE